MKLFAARAYGFLIPFKTSFSAFFFTESIAAGKVLIVGTAFTGNAFITLSLIPLIVAESISGSFLPNESTSDGLTPVCPALPLAGTPLPGGGLAAPFLPDGFALPGDVMASLDSGLSFGFQR